MAVLSNVSCGGINLNNSAFATSNNIITTFGTTASASHTTTPCGVLFDSNVFTVKKNTEGANVLTSVNSVESKISSTVKASCGMLADARYFSVTNNVMSFADGYVLTVNVTAPTSGYTVVVKQGSTVISVMSGTTNQYFLSSIGSTYDVTVSATGYSTKTQSFSNTQNRTLSIALSALESIAVTTAPTKTAYTVGETFDSTGMVITATYADSTTAAVTGYTYSPTVALTTEDTTITITYQGKTTTQAITVTA